MNSLLKIIRWISNHPLSEGRKLKALRTFISWQINVRINPYPIIYLWVNNSRLIVQRGMTGATGNLYAGLHDFEDMAFLLHFLRKEDTFIDIGSNIGSYTVLASGGIGAKSVAIEPIPSTFHFLKMNIAVNDMVERVLPLNIGLGSKHAILHFTKTQDTVNHVAVEGEKDTIDVPVRTLDEITADASCPALMKIDVEGFETEVLRGGEWVLSNTELKAVIIELNGSGARYGYKDADIHQTFLTEGFRPYGYEPFTRKLIEQPSYSTEVNTIYIRDVEYVCKRVEEADPFEVLGKQI